MSCYVDPQAKHGFRLGMKEVPSCHLFADTKEELEEMAKQLKFQPCLIHKSYGGVEHYDLSPNKRIQAIKYGAIEVSFREAVRIWPSVV